MARGAIVWGVDPVVEGSGKYQLQPIIVRTAIFAEVEAQKDEDHTANDEEQADEVKLAGMFPPRPPMVRVQVEEEEQQEETHTARRPASTERQQPVRLSRAT